MDKWLQDRLKMCIRHSSKRLKGTEKRLKRKYKDNRMEVWIKDNQMVT